MKLSCEVIKDLLPLYVEDLTSSETNRLVEEHLETCEECKQELELLKNPKKILPDTETLPFKKVEEKLFKRDIKKIILTILSVLLIGTIAINYMVAPEYLPYSENNISLIKQEDGTIIATLSENVAGYDVEKVKTETGKGYKYSVTTWSSTWNQYIVKNKKQNIVLNPEGEEVTSIYYYFPNGERPDQLIYGANLYGNGGVLTLPRLALSYYMGIAIILTILFGFLLVMNRKKERVKNVIEGVLLLPISYMMGHVAIKGFTSTTYSMRRDFFAILGAASIIYLFLLLGLQILKKENRKGKTNYFRKTIYLESMEE